jgi:hypothetical protein
MVITGEHINYILGVIAIISIIFSIWFAIRRPQEKTEINQAVVDKELANKATTLEQKEVETKVILLAQQVQWEKEANEKKFNEFSCRLTEAMTLAQNHIHTVDVKVDSLIGVVGEMKICMGELKTIINERIPRK